MEKVLEQALPEVTKTIEIPVELPIAEPETSGIGWGQGVGIVAAVVVVAYLAKRVRCCKK